MKNGRGPGRYSQVNQSSSIKGRKAKRGFFQRLAKKERVSASKEEKKEGNGA